MKYCLSISFLLVAVISVGQNKIIEKIRQTVTKDAAQAQLMFLASDELRGRGTGSPEIAIAASYISTQFMMMGLKPAPGSSSYYQEVPLQRGQPPVIAEFHVGKDVYVLRDNLIVLKGKSVVQQGEIVFVGYGTAEEIGTTDLKGKIVVSYAGYSSTSTISSAYLNESPSKYAMVRDKGAAALVEILAFPELNWQRISARLGASRVSLAENNSNDDAMPHVWMINSTQDGVAQLLVQKRAEGSLRIDALEPRPLSEKNIVGWIEGTDAKLKEEFVVISAHYDHLGVRKNATPDSIYNGARDNAIGVTAILETAEFLSRNRPKRSVLILAACAEEVGLLGSRWYTNHPLVPLNKTVFNMDCDGAGYNDKTLVTVVDLNRTTIDDAMKKASAAFGLILKGDPAPEQNLYERSDNYNFAAKGVPAVDVSPGVKGFDEEIIKYYHQPADEAQTLDFEYLEKFFHAFVYSAVLITNAPARPFWKAGDKFESTGKALYNMN